MGADPYRQPVRFWQGHLGRSTGCGHHLPGPDVWTAHALHVVHRCAGNRAPHRRRGGRCGPAAAAATGRVRSRGRDDERCRTRVRVDISNGCRSICRELAVAACTVGDRVVRTKLCVLALAALAAWGLKHHYAVAGPDELWWILAPTAQAVGVATGATFRSIPGEGYVSREHLFVIEKSCAGVNFMIAAFSMLALTFSHRIT